MVFDTIGVGSVPTGAAMEIVAQSVERRTMGLDKGRDRNDFGC